MKRKKLMQLLAKAGFTFQEGGNHTKVYKNNVRVSEVPRHTEIDNRLVKAICKQTGLKIN